MPADINTDRCLGLYVNLIDASLMSTTKGTLILKDCSGKEIFITKQGKSKHKDNKSAYSEVLQGAMESFDGVIHSYKPKTKTSNIKEAPITVSFRNDIKKIDEKPRLIICKNKSVKQEATLEKQSFKDRTPISSSIKKAASTNKGMVEQKSIESINNSHLSSKGMLSVQEIPNGYQLVDSKSNIRLKLYKCTIPNVYLAHGEGKDGVVYSMNEQWFFEYYKSSKFISEELKIQF